MFQAVRYFMKHMVRKPVVAFLRVLIPDAGGADLRYQRISVF